MKTNQRGALDIMFVFLLVVLVAVGGFVGWRVLDADKTVSQTAANTEDGSSVPIDSNTKEANQEASDSVAILELDSPIDLTQPSDTDKLPSQTPASFIEFMKTELDQEPDEFNCISAYSVTRVSNVNISGSIGSVDPSTMESGDSCFGGAILIWYFMNNQWDSSGFQAVPECVEIAKTTIYSEFLQTCSDKEFNNINNPNGSIYNIN